jgi:hypothetical protein
MQGLVMKIKDIIVENTNADIPPRLQQATVGLTRFRDGQFADRIYELNRVMMAAAMADGISPITIDQESWAGRNNIAAPYTKQEQAMLTQAFDAVGTHYTDLNHGDLDSEELKSTNAVSPIAKPKRNKFGV